MRSETRPVKLILSNFPKFFDLVFLGSVDLCMTPDHLYAALPTVHTVAERLDCFS